MQIKVVRYLSVGMLAPYVNLKCNERKRAISIFKSRKLCAGVFLSLVIFSHVTNQTKNMISEKAQETNVIMNFLI